MKAIVDCNSFYCSCERLFRPELHDKPVVVLSNNDGCIVSRSDEAKDLGIPMAAPYFKAKSVIEKYKVATFSSNYTLYGDLSWRVMETLRIMFGKKNVEVYSVDEAFLDLSGFDRNQLEQVALQIKETVEQWTGIKVSVGIAPTKVLAKVANKLSKKNKVETQCIMVLDSEEKIIEALYQTPVSEIWGVGWQYAKMLKDQHAIFTALDLRNKKEDWAKKYLGGVVGIRLLKELQAIPYVEIRKELLTKKMIMTTRMFGHAVDNIKDIKEAISTYISRTAEKLRRQKSAAKTIYIYIVPKEISHENIYIRGNSIGNYVTLPTATSATDVLIKFATALVDKIYEKGRKYKKAGVILSNLVPDNSIQANVFVQEKDNCKRLLMNAIDNINFSMRDDILKFASSGMQKNWKMRQELRSPRYTTRWEELFVVK